CSSDLSPGVPPVSPVEPPSTPSPLPPSSLPPWLLFAPPELVALPEPAALPEPPTPEPGGAPSSPSELHPKTVPQARVARTTERTPKPAKRVFDMGSRQCAERPSTAHEKEGP